MEGLGQLQKYRLMSPIAKGGMGEVFLARQEGPRGFVKTVVVKRLLEHLSSDDSFVEMFLNEARLAAILSHPNIVQIFELGEEEGSYFLTMEHVHGRSLRAIRKKLHSFGMLLRPTFAARIGVEVLRGLHYAHNLTDPSGGPLEIVHRDVSPENILVGFNGMVKLVDFGISKASFHVATARSGALKGKFRYMAPEQLSSGKVDARADVYAMGVVLYEALTGQRPYGGNTDEEVMEAVLRAPLRAPVELKPDIPSLLNAIVLKALAKAPEERFDTAEDMGQALEAYLETTGEKVSDTELGSLLVRLFGRDAACNPQPLPRPKASGPSARTPRAIGSAVEIPIDLSEAAAPGSFLQARKRWLAHAAVLTSLLVGMGFVAFGNLRPTSLGLAAVTSPKSAAASIRAGAARLPAPSVPPSQGKGTALPGNESPAWWAALKRGAASKP